MDTLRKNLQHQFDQCLPSTKSSFGVLIDEILADSDKVDLELNYDTRIKGIYVVIDRANRILNLDNDLKKLMSKK